MDWKRAGLDVATLGVNEIAGNPFGASPNPAAPPGIVLGPPPDPGRLVDNGAGTLLDPVTGQAYQKDEHGAAIPITNPNVAQQVGADASRAAGFYNQAPGYDAREQSAYNRETGLADTLNSVALGHGPSVAGAQLAVGLDQGARQQLAQAAGASGNNAALARLGAMQNTAGLQAKANQDASLVRAQEVANAQRTLAGLTTTMADQSRGMAGQKIGAAGDLNHLALQGETDRERQQFETDKVRAANDRAQRDRVLDTAGANLQKAGVGGG